MTQVAGWGGTEFGDADELQKMEYRWANQLSCERYWGYRRMDIHDGMICTDRMNVGEI